MNILDKKEKKKKCEAFCKNGTAVYECDYCHTLYCKNCAKECMGECGWCIPQLIKIKSCQQI